MVYYEIRKVKDRCNMDQGDATFDNLLNDFGLASDQEVDARLYEMASKDRQLFQIPVLPLAAPVDQAVRDASTDRTVAKWWRKQKDWNAVKDYLASSELAITNYIARLHVDIVRYGILIGDS